MKKNERSYEKYSMQQPRERFFRLTIFKAFIFGLIFMGFVYYTSPGNMNHEERVINSILYIGSMTFIYIFSCSIAWVFRKARR